MALFVDTTSARPPPASKSSCRKIEGTVARLMPSSLSNEKYWKLYPNENRPRPIVSARSVRIGPKLCDVRTNVPVDGSNRYVKPEAGDGSGRLASWLASATSNCSKFDWKALLKWPECVEPSGSTA